MPRSVDPDELSEVADMFRGEREFMESTSRKTLRVKVEEGDSWLIRFLPVEMGPRKIFFARISQHWINRRPYFCARSTPADFGGVPKSECTLCALAEELNRSTNREVSSVGYRAGANAQWMMYCLVFEKADEIIQGDDRWVPYQFWHNRTTFDEFIHIHERSVRNGPLGSIDLITGFDFVVRNGKRGMTIRPEQPSSIFDKGSSEEENQAIVDKIWAEIKIPSYTPLTNDEMDAAYTKLEEEAQRAKSPGSRRRADYDDDDDRRGSRRGGDDDAPRSRRGGDDDAPRSRHADDSPAPSRSRRDPEPDRPASPRVSTRAESRPEPAAERPAAPRVSRPAQTESAPAPRTSRRSEPQPELPLRAEPSKVPSTSQSVRPPSVSARLAPPVRAASSQAPTVSSEGTSLDDQDNVAAERRDPAPATSSEADDDPLPEDVAPQPVVPAEQPPAAGGKPRLSDRLKKTLQTL